MTRALAVLAAVTAVACSGSAGAGVVEETREMPDVVVATSGPKTPPQGSFTGASAACGDLFAYRATEDGTQFLGVTLDAFPRDATTVVYDLGGEPESVRVTVDVFASPPTDLSCADLARPLGAKTTWLAEAGRVEIDVAGGDVTIRLEDIHVVGPERGIAIVVPKAVIEHAKPGG